MDVRSKTWGGQAMLALAAVVALAMPQGAWAHKDAHTAKDIQRHRAMAAAHEAAAKCLESGKKEEACQKDLQAACKGLAIGKTCGMKHEH